MRKFKINLYKPPRKNSGKTWETPCFVYFDNLSYRVYENDIIFIFDFIKYKMELSIYESYLLSFLKELHHIFKKEELREAIERLKYIRHQNMFCFDEDTGIFTLKLEIAKKLRDIRTNINNALYDITIYFCFSQFKNRKNVLIIDKNRTISNIDRKFLKLHKNYI